MQVNTLKHSASQYWAGAAAFSNQGFEIPTCSAKSPAYPLVFAPCADFDHLCYGKAYRVQTTQPGLDGAEFWYYAKDIAIPSVIYRAMSPNNPMGYVFDMIPISETTCALRTLDGLWLTRQTERLVATPTYSQECWFELFAF